MMGPAYRHNDLQGIDHQTDSERDAGTSGVGAASEISNEEAVDAIKNCAEIEEAPVPEPKNPFNDLARSSNWQKHYTDQQLEQAIRDYYQYKAQSDDDITDIQSMTLLRQAPIPGAVVVSRGYHVALSIDWVGADVSGPYVEDGWIVRPLMVQDRPRSEPDFQDD